MRAQSTRITIFLSKGKSYWQCWLKAYLALSSLFFISSIQGLSSPSPPEVMP